MQNSTCARSEVGAAIVGHVVVAAIAIIAVGDIVVNVDIDAVALTLAGLLMFFGQFGNDGLNLYKVILKNE